MGHLAHGGFGLGNAFDKDLPLLNAQVSRIRFQQVTGFLQEDAPGLFGRPNHSDPAGIGNPRPPGA